MDHRKTDRQTGSFVQFSSLLLLRMLTSMDGSANRQTDRHRERDRQTGRKIDRQKKRKENRYTDTA